MIIFLAVSFFSLVVFIESYDDMETKILIALISNLQIFYIIILIELYFSISFLLVIVESYQEILQYYVIENRPNNNSEKKKKALNEAKLGFFRNMTLLVFYFKNVFY